MKRKTIVIAATILCIGIGVFSFFNIHLWKEWETPASCMNEGAVHRQCTICKKTEMVTEVPLIGHAESEWITDKKETCTEEGKYHTICNRCGIVVEEKKVEPVSHSYRIDEIPADEEMPYYVSFRCEHCEDYYRDSAQPSQMGLAGDFEHDIDYDFIGYGMNRYCAMTGWDPNGDGKRYHTDGAPEMKVYVLRDSFFTYMMPFFSYCYSDVFVRHVELYRSGEIFDENPDMIVLSFCERRLGDLKNIEF